MYYGAIDLIEEFGYDFCGIKGQRELTEHFATADVAEAFLNDPYHPDGTPKPSIVCSTEADSDAALTMQIFKHLAGTPVLFADVRHYHADLGLWDLCNSGEHATYFAGRSDDPAVNLAQTEFRPQGFYFPAGGASVYHVAAPGPVTLARLTRRAGRYRMVAFRAEFADLGARAHEVAAISQDNWPHAFAKFSCTPDAFIQAFNCNHIHGVYGDCLRELAGRVRRARRRVRGARLMAAVIGLDFGTESARALVVDVRDGRVLGSGVGVYRHGVIDEQLPSTGAALGAEWALQHPGNWLEALETSVREALASARVAAADIVGLGIDFTACTVLPVRADGVPLMHEARYSGEPHAWPKLWKHHASQPQATRVTEVAAARGETWLARYGGRISSEWMLPKALQVLEEAPEVFAAADLIVEGGDWVVWQLTGQFARNACAAGYKGLWHKHEGYPSDAYLQALHPGLERVLHQQGRRPAGRGAGDARRHADAGVGGATATRSRAPPSARH